MNLKTLIPILLIVVVGTALFLNGCKDDKSPKNIGDAHQVATDEVTVYFSKSRGSEAVTEGVVRQRPEVATGKPEDVEDLEYAINELLEGPNRDESMQGFYSEIPKGTRLLGVSGEQLAYHVDLSSQFTSGGGSNSVQQRVQELTRTVFAALPDGAKVYVMVNGKPVELVSGEGLEIKQPLERALQ